MCGLVAAILAASFFGAIAFPVFAAAGLAAGSAVFVAPKQNAAAANDRATATTPIRVLIMKRFRQKRSETSIPMRARNRDRELFVIRYLFIRRQIPTINH